MRLDESNSGRFLRESLELCMECYYLAERYREKDINEALRSRLLSKYLLSEVISSDELSKAKDIAGQYEGIKEKITKIKDALPAAFANEKKKLEDALRKFDISSLPDLILGGDQKKLSAFYDTVATVGSQVITYATNIVNAFETLTELFDTILPKSDTDKNSKTLRAALGGSGPAFEKKVKDLKDRLLAAGPDANFNDALEKGFNFKPGGFGQKLRSFLRKIGASDGWLTPAFMKSLLGTTIGDLRRAAALISKEVIKAAEVPDATQLAAPASSVDSPGGGSGGASPTGGGAGDSSLLPLDKVRKEITAREDELERAVKSLLVNVKDIARSLLSDDGVKVLKDALSLEEPVAKETAKKLREGILVFLDVERAYSAFSFAVSSGNDYPENSQKLVVALREASTEYGSLADLLDYFKGLSSKDKLAAIVGRISGIRYDFKNFADAVDGNLIPAGTITLKESLRARGDSSNVLGERMLRIAGVL